jgi:glycosyltransferase involved in cell wall biosynthesis
MSAGAVHQLIPSFAPRDAVGNHTVQVQRVLRDLGFDSEIYAGNARREVAGLSRPFDELAPAPGTWLLYQASTGSPMVDWLLGRTEPLLVNYHNITPASLFGPWEPHVGVELEAGRRQMKSLARRTRFAIADSTYNEAELLELGYGDTAVVPILLDTTLFEKDVDERALARLRHTGAVWLFVGRIAPNKAQHDLIKAFAAYRLAYDPDARLRLVGGTSSHAYWTALVEYIAALELGPYVELCGDVPDGVLAAHYRAADVYVSASDHEGFGVPLLEAMHHRVPVIAYGSTAVPETVGTGGLVLADKEPATVAAAVHRVVSDQSLREGLVAAGTRRVADFDLATNRKRFGELVQQAMGASEASAVDRARASEPGDDGSGAQPQGNAAS